MVRTFAQRHRTARPPRYRVRMETTTSTGAGRPNTDLAAVVDQALALAEKQVPALLPPSWPRAAPASRLRA